MKHKKLSSLTDEQKNKIISAAYGNVSLWDKLIVGHLVSSNEEAKKLYLSYKQTAKEVRLLSEDECPAEILKNVQRESINALNKKNSFLFDLYSAAFSRPIISAAATLVLTVSIVIALILNRPIQYNYTQAQIINADRQTKEAFMIVGKILRDTRTTLQKEVLGEKVSKPLHQGIGIVNKLFEGEKK